jgi:hypothetical protein
MRGAGRMVGTDECGGSDRTRGVYCAGDDQSEGRIDEQGS